MIKPENFRFRALCGRTVFSSYKYGAPGEARTHNYGVGGHRFIRLDYGCVFSIQLLSYELVQTFVVIIPQSRKPSGNFGDFKPLFFAEVGQRRVLVPQLGVDDGKRDICVGG